MYNEIFNFSNGLDRKRWPWREADRSKNGLIATFESWLGTLIERKGAEYPKERS